MALNYCCKELHVTCGKIPGFASGKVLGLAEEYLLHLQFGKNFNALSKPIEYLLYIGVYVNLLKIY